MTRWLVRTTTNQIHGPFSKEDLISSIQDGRWEQRDEACCENHYWFSFNEAEELRRQLGINWPEHIKASMDREEETDEITEVETKTIRIEPDSLLTNVSRPISSVFIQQGVEMEPERDPWWSHPGFWVFFAILSAFLSAIFLS
ncbi:MAG: hypothetical protein KGQ59_07740 [Bdellovibrionales bacterium]|nr:hypothetical protein [Bdellovibrionales bacterium]